MSRLPEDLLDFLRSNKLGKQQRKLIRELALECGQRRLSVGEYAGRYVKRALKIARTLGGPRLT